MVLYDDGSSSYLAEVTATATMADGATQVASGFTVTNEAIFSDVADATDFALGNFTFIA
jgi:hypothetical protein